MTPQDLLANFGTLVEAPNGIQRMRELVLELAVRGKLVEQDPREPRVDSVKEVTSDVPDDLLYLGTSIPTNWVPVKLSDVVSSRSGNSKLIKGKLSSEANPSLFPAFSASGQDVWCETWEWDETAIVVSAVGARCGKTFLAQGKWTAIANTSIIRPNWKAWNPGFAQLFFNNENFWVRGGSAQPFVKFPPSLARHIALPPIAEQRRIVVRVYELMALLDRLEAKRQDREAARTAARDSALAALREAPTPDDVETGWLRIQERFHELFATPEDVEPLRALLQELAVCGRLVKPNPEQWASCRLDETGEWAIGAGFPTALQGRSDQEYGFCKVSDMNLPGNDRYITKTNHTVSAHDLQKLRAKAHPPGTVIFPKIGGAIATNKRRLLARPTAIDNNCLGITPRREVLPEWLFLILKSIDLSKYQSGTSVPALAQGVIGAIPVNVPPIDDQRATLRRVDELMSLLSRLSQTLTSTSNFASSFAAAAVHHLET